MVKTIQFHTQQSWLYEKLKEEKMLTFLDKQSIDAILFGEK